MKELIGVRSLVSAWFTKTLKRDALTFSRIAVPGSQVFMSTSDDELESASEMRWLFDQNIIFDPLLLDVAPLKGIIQRHRDDPFMTGLRELMKLKPTEAFKNCYRSARSVEN